MRRDDLLAADFPPVERTVFETFISTAATVSIRLSFTSLLHTRFA